MTEVEITRFLRDRENEKRAARRRWLYRNDPIWRLTKLKDNWERKARNIERRTRAQRGVEHG